jgi:hypothetical protein
MQIWNVTMTALQPISIAREPNRESHWDTAWSIPGSTWRGAISEIWKYKAGFGHEKTKQLVDDCIFRDAHPKGTAFYPSFWRSSKTSGQTEEILTEYLKEGAFRTTHSKDRGMLLELAPFEAPVIENTAVGITISETREAVKHGKLYTLSAIAEGTVFETTAIIPEDVLQLIAEGTKEGFAIDVYIGKKRFSGYGKTRILFQKADGTMLEEKVKNKVESAPYQISDELHIVLTNKSPLILRDPFLRPANELDWMHHISHLSDQPDLFSSIASKIRGQFSWGTAHLRHGWNQAWNAPKPAEWAISSGTVHVTAFSGLDEEEKAYLYGILAKIESAGLGERVNEGFGEVVVAPALSMESPRAQKAEDSHLPKAHFNRKLLTLAEKFVEETQYSVPASQWHSVLELDDIINELTSTEPDKYLQKRIGSAVRNIWRRKAGNQIIGDIVREYVHMIIDENKDNASQSVRGFFQYVVRYSQIEKKKEGAKK